MSYLGPLRLHFAGRFQAAVSTVNNDPAHYDNESFKPSDQELENPKERRPNRGWWNPRGDADWRLVGCEVTSAFLPDGTPAAAGDPVLETTVADSDRMPPAKLVDLDPCQQLVSTVWGLEMRLADAAGKSLMRGSYEPAAFMDIWNRAARQASDLNASATYQSVLTGVEWEGIDDSPFLLALREATPDGILSVKFTVDGYNMTFGHPDFTLGRIVGTIGPAAPAEPRHMVVGRQLAAADGARTPEEEELSFFIPKGRINFCAARVDEGTGKVYLDLGNALPTDEPGGEIEGLGPLSLHVGDEVLCEVPYEGKGWYAQTAGVVALPADRRLTAEEMSTLAQSPISLWWEGKSEAAVTETPGYVAADTFVFRCDPGDSVELRLFASRFGEPAVGAEVLLTRDVSRLQELPNMGQPEDAIEFPASVVTGSDGVAVAEVKTKDPGRPRGWIDGQVYGIRPTLAKEPATPVNRWNFVSLLLWSAFEHANPPTWLGDLQPTFQQYANLYPIMRDFLDLSDYEDVCANRNLLLLAFQLDLSDPNSMPVTRDLSRAKREAILTWLTNLGPDGKPLLGEAPPQPAAAPAAVETTPRLELNVQGGKAAAVARQLIHRQGRS